MHKPSPPCQPPTASPTNPNKCEHADLFASPLRLPLAAAMESLLLDLMVPCNETIAQATALLNERLRQSAYGCVDQLLEVLLGSHRPEVHSPSLPLSLSFAALFKTPSLAILAALLCTFPVTWA